MCLQETKLADDKFPTDVFSDLGYESVHHGRWPLERGRDRQPLGPSDPVRASGRRGRSRLPDHRRHLGGVRVTRYTCPTVRSLDNEFYAIKLDWLARLRIHAGHLPGGDFGRGVRRLQCGSR